ncbi:hypothetical protein PMZ80_002971 [Knufia obscura]|uniref:Homeobox domain-containing protein n=1 Tax=Knufia obscura TaxID=1635080 RepID=A0ABR0RYT5_9EURO|nr:hypothetical protein PMZ80_002971 [Knufia obscura]
MSHSQPESIVYHHQTQYPSFHPQLARPELSYNPYIGFQDYADDMHAGMYYGDFEDSNEVSTRPRLTKDQVDILEHEFQKNAKPNSVLKRHLAATTNLNLPRVANWFQNRRAKAKQQRKQEEFEQQQCKGVNQGPSGDSGNDDDDDEDEEVKQEEEDLHSRSTEREPVAAARGSHAMASPLRSPKSESSGTDVRDRAHASLQRAIAAAHAAQYKVTFQPSPAVEQCPELPSSLLSQIAASPLGAVPQAQLPSGPQMQHDWQQMRMPEDPWTSTPSIAGDMVFDFGFDKPGPQVLANNARLPSPADSNCHGLMSSDPWESNLSTPTVSMAPQSHFQPPLSSPGLQMTSYVGNRRGSAADGLTSNFEGIALATAAPQMSFQSSESVSSGASEGGVDLASRRRRPRPAALTSAALTSASLRSRSYGALTATSPTFRQSMTPPSGHALRHVKSTGHSLNSHYPGIRKSSIPHRSPLNFSTFAESEAFRELMAQKAAEDCAEQQLTPVNTTQMSYNAPQEPMVRSLSQMVHSNAAPGDLSQRPQMHSPPITPFQQDFYLQSSSMMPPSVQVQYANLADHTPPYSAGPLTNTSWSDAPLTTPDLANFPNGNIVPSLPYGAPSEDQHNVPWMFSADQSPSFTANTPTESKKTEFYMQEFPNQREEHARAAKLLDHPRPKHYAFDNKGQQDYKFSPS